MFHTGTYQRPTSALFIGGSSGAGAWFGGPLDDVRICNRALSAQEIWQLYTAQ